MKNIRSISVVIAGFFAQFICEGIGQGCELFLPYLQKSFSWNNTQVTLIGSSINGLAYLLGPLSSFLAQKFGDRPLMIFCGVLGAGGFVAGAFSQELWQLVLTISLAGASVGLASVPSMTAVSFHFTKRRHLFTTLATTGGAVGCVILPFVLESVLITSPWQYAFIVAAGIMLHLSVCGALFFPPQDNNNNNHEEKQGLNLTQPATYDNVPDDKKIKGDKRVNETNALLKSDTIEGVHNYSALALWCFLIHTIIWTFGTFMYYTIIPLRLDKEGYSGYEIALVFSVISFLVIGGRLTACCFVFWKKCDVVLVYNFSTLVMGGVLIWVSWKQSLMIYIIGLSTYGFFFGLITAVIPSVIITLVQLDRVKRVAGLQFFTTGISGLFGPLLGGWLLDLLNNDFFVVCIISSMLLMVAVPLLLPFHWPIRKN